MTYTDANIGKILDALQAAGDDLVVGEEKKQKQKQTQYENINSIKNCSTKFRLGCNVHLNITTT